jgi:hypothetical protein
VTVMRLRSPLRSPCDCPVFSSIAYEQKVAT